MMNIKNTLKITALGSAFLLLANSAYANPSMQNFSQTNQHTVPMQLPTRQNTVSGQIPIQQMNTLTVQQAKQMVLNHAGLNSSQIGFMRVEKDFDDGRMEYEIEFTKDKYEYEYKVNANTGQITEHRFEKKRNKLFNIFNSSQPDNLVSGDYAKNIALSHAGLQPNQVVMGEFSYDFDDGEHLYEIGFYKDYIEYKYEIDAETGEIYQCEVKYHI